MKKHYFRAFLLAVTASLLLCGCGANDKGAVYNLLFPQEELTAPDSSDVEGAKAFKSKLAPAVHPAFVPEMEKPDKTLINPMFSLSTEGFPVVSVLGKNNYFHYDLLTAPDFDALDKLTEPTNINVMLYRENYSDWSVRFSGFVYKIDPDYVYIGTAGHCIDKSSNVKRAKVTFFDRSSIKVSLEEYILGGNFRDTVGDYAMYRFPTSALPYETLLKLKEVTFDEAAIEKVKPGDIIYSGNIYAKNSSEDYDRQCKVLDKSSDIVKYYAGYFGYINSSSYFATDPPLTSGQSGSAIFDAYGNVVAICSGEMKDSKYAKMGIFTLASKIDDLYDQFQAQDLGQTP